MVDRGNRLSQQITLNVCMRSIGVEKPYSSGPDETTPSPSLPIERQCGSLHKNSFRRCRSQYQFRCFPASSLFAVFLWCGVRA